MTASVGAAGRGNGGPGSTAAVVAELDEQRDDGVQHDPLGREQFPHVADELLGRDVSLSAYFFWSAATANCRSLAAIIRLFTSGSFIGTDHTAPGSAGARRGMRAAGAAGAIRRGEAALSGGGG